MPEGFVGRDTQMAPTSCDGLESLEPHVVLEESVREFLDGSALSHQHAVGQADVRIADVLGRDRQQDALPRSVRALAREQVEQHRERRLAAAGQRDVTLGERPAVLECESLRERDAECMITRRARVARRESTQLRIVAGDLAQAPTVDRFHGRDPRRIAATQHVHGAASRQLHGLAEVRHQLQRAGGSQDPRAEFRRSELHGTGSA